MERGFALKQTDFQGQEQAEMRAARSVVSGLGFPRSFVFHSSPPVFPCKLAYKATKLLKLLFTVFVITTGEMY
jgi:hypothetical protein